MFDPEYEGHIMLNNQAPVADHLVGFNGRTSAPIALRTGPPQHRVVIYRAENSDGSCQEIVEKEMKALNSGLISWREIFDFSMRLNNDGGLKGD